MASFYDQIKQAIPVDELLAKLGHVPEREYGNKKWYLCPLPDHGEKTPSFKVENDLFYCFGCAEGGSVIELLRHFVGKTKIEVIEWIRDNFAIEITDNGPVAPRKPETEKKSKEHFFRFELEQLARRHCQQQLNIKRSQELLGRDPENDGLWEAAAKQQQVLDATRIELVNFFLQHDFQVMFPRRWRQFVFQLEDEELIEFWLQPEIAACIPYAKACSIAQEAEALSTQLREIEANA